MVPPALEPLQLPPPRHSSSAGPEQLLMTSVSGSTWATRRHHHHHHHRRRRHHHWPLLKPIVEPRVSCRPIRIDLQTDTRTDANDLPFPPICIFCHCVHFEHFETGGVTGQLHWLLTRLVACLCQLVACTATAAADQAACLQRLERPRTGALVVHWLFRAQRRRKSRLLLTKRRSVRDRRIISKQASCTTLAP